MTTKSIISTIFLLGVFLSAKAVNYYVATTGNDTNTGTTTTAPFKTIQKALDKVIAGDKINVLGGIYKERLIWKTSGTAAAPITLTNYNGSIVYVDGSSGGTNTTQNQLLKISTKSHFVISSIQFRNNYGASAGGILISGEGTNISVLNCKIFNVGWTTSKTTIPTSGNNASPFLVLGQTAVGFTNVTVTGNQIYNCIPGYSECLTINGNVDNFMVSNNSVYNNTNIGIDIAGRWAWTGAPASVNFARNGTVRDNIVYNCVSLVASSAGIYVDGAQNILIERNKCYSNGVGFSIGCENAGFTVSDIILRDNICYNNKGVGMYFGSNNATSQVTNSTVSNNTFFKNSTAEQWGAEIALQNTANCKINQNIFVPNNNLAVAIGIWGYTTTSLTADYNLFWRTTGITSNILASVTATNSVYGDPKLANISTKDFHLVTGSKAINAGHPTFVAAANELDFDKTTRVKMARVDIGAYENTLVTLSPAITSPNTNVSFRGTTAYPNPTTGLVQVSLLQKALTLDVVSAEGRVMEHRSLDDSLQQNIDISTLPEGIYVFKIGYADSSREDIKILKK